MELISGGRQYLLCYCLLLAVAAHGASALGLSKYLKYVAQPKIWLARSPSSQLDSYLNDKTDSRELSENMNALLDLTNGAVQSSSIKRNGQSWDAAERMSRLHSIRDGFCDTTAATTEALESVREILVRDFGPRFATDSASSSRRIVRLFNEALRTHVRSCLTKYQQDWAQVDVPVDVLGSDPIAARTLDIMHEVFRELMCAHAYKGARLPVSAFECSLQKVDESLANQRDAWDVFQTIEAAQVMRDDNDEHDGENLKKLYAAQTTEEINQLLDDTLGQACQKLIDNPRAQASVARVPQLVALAPPLTDELLPADGPSDRLLEWTSRAIVCKRLMDRTDREQLNAGVLKWVESHRARKSGEAPASS